MAVKKDVLSLMESKYSKKKIEIIEKYKTENENIVKKFDYINEQILEELTNMVKNTKKLCGLKFKLNNKSLFDTTWYDHNNGETKLAKDRETIRGLNVDYGGLDIYKRYEEIKKRKNNKLEKLHDMYEKMREQVILYGVNDELLKLLKKFEKFK